MLQDTPRSWQSDSSTGRKRRGMEESEGDDASPHAKRSVTWNRRDAFEDDSPRSVTTAQRLAQPRPGMQGGMSPI
jgi:hypothetical protein